MFLEYRYVVGKHAQQPALQILQIIKRVGAACEDIGDLDAKRIERVALQKKAWEFSAGVPKYGHVGHIRIDLNLLNAHDSMSKVRERSASLYCYG